MLTSDKSTITFNTELCKKCGLCSHYCPRKVIHINDEGYPYVKHPEKCKRCYLCFHRCPDFALEVKEDEKKIPAGQ